MKADEFPTLEGYQLVALGEADVANLQRLQERCADFKTLVTGAAPGPEAAAELLAAAPPGLPLERKQVIGVLASGDLVGAIDLLRDFPEDRTWYLGLMMLAPEARGGGLGTRLYGALTAWVADCGGERIRLVVQRQNPRALAFWTRMGFEQIGTATQQLSDSEHEVLRMEHRLPV
ncbi:N-acetyltransferase [Phenylobacterium sp.]|uniref:GNAT family N-acetyltransferase n=1 Tax=Phenylobacterium sp. TaxID=1871053 RepID=UPI002735C934|nr:GNAT family N-acetyltransferase [Phenylobacterium sp.]MDP3855636.1 GNAT family N-acetyltransferase [Phenylobacterium sp.]